MDWMDILITVPVISLIVFCLIQRKERSDGTIYRTIAYTYVLSAVNVIIAVISILYQFYMGSVDVILVLAAVLSLICVIVTAGTMLNKINGVLRTVPQE